MAKLMTKVELENWDDLSPEDKALVEQQVTEYGGGREDPPDIPLRQAIRGYLVRRATEEAIDEQVRLELPYDAACFADGWEAAMEYHKTTGS